MTASKRKTYRGRDLLRLCEQYVTARRAVAGNRRSIRDGAPRVLSAYKALSDFWRPAGVRVSGSGDT